MPRIEALKRYVEECSQVGIAEERMHIDAETFALQFGDILQYADAAARAQAIIPRKGEDGFRHARRYLSRPRAPRLAR